MQQGAGGSHTLTGGKWKVDFDKMRQYVVGTEHKYRAVRRLGAPDPSQGPEPEPQRLSRSVIVVQSPTIASLLELVFYLQPPVAPVYLTRDAADAVEAALAGDMDGVKDEAKPCGHGGWEDPAGPFGFEVTSVIRPGKPLFPFL